MNNKLKKSTISIALLIVTILILMSCGMTNVSRNSDTSSKLKISNKYYWNYVMKVPQETFDDVFKRDKEVIQINHLMSDGTKYIWRIKLYSDTLTVLQKSDKTESIIIDSIKISNIEIVEFSNLLSDLDSYEGERYLVGDSTGIIMCFDGVVGEVFWCNNGCYYSETHICSKQITKVDLIRKKIDDYINRMLLKRSKQ